jgi:hypothetical protein
LPVDEGALYGGGATIGRQKGGVDVEAAETGTVEQGIFYQPGIIDNKGEVRRVRLEFIKEDRVRRRPG